MRSVPSPRAFSTLAAVLAFAVAAAIGPSMADAQGGRGGGGGHHGGSDSASGPVTSGPAPIPQVVLTPHGGQYIATEANHYEVVYMPLQTRIYLYDDKMKPLTARDVHAQMSLELPLENTPRHVAFQYVASPPGSAEQDYVVAGFDLRVLQDKETPITLEFSGLPDRQHPTISFTPIFSRTRLRPYVARVLPTEADRAGVIRQRFCPVSGDLLGTKGPIVKVCIADFPLYLCNEGCIETVRQSPERFLPRPVAPPGR